MSWGLLIRFIIIKGTGPPKQIYPGAASCSQLCSWDTKREENKKANRARAPPNLSIYMHYSLLNGGSKDKNSSKIKTRRTGRMINLFIHQGNGSEKCMAPVEVKNWKKWDPLRPLGCEMSSARCWNQILMLWLELSKWDARERQLTSRRGDEAKLIAIRKRLYYIQHYSIAYRTGCAWHPVSFGLIIWLIITCSASLSTTSTETWSRSRSGEIFCCALNGVLQKEKILISLVWEHILKVEI